MSAPFHPIEPCVFCDEVSPDFEESCRLCAGAGAVALEIRGRMFGKDVTGIDDNDVARMKQIMAQYGLRVAAIGSPFGKCHMERPDEIARHHAFFPRMVELAQTFGTTVIRGFAFWNPLRGLDSDRPDIQQYLPRIVDFLAPAVKQAEAAGVFLCLETEGATMTGTLHECRQVLDAVGSPALGVAWDVLNGLMCGEIPLPDGYEEVRGRVRHVHVKPNRDKNMRTVGDTRVTYADIFHALLADGYQGVASIEHWGSPDLMLAGVRELAALLRG
ncbi:MAG: sugar phosphate isomerase/epimerase family protein [Armatimonadota bacterium]|nr:sugar phosphate isomerase/epimerase family protein [Armatimonadota bacterium]